MLTHTKEKSTKIETLLIHLIANPQGLNTFEANALYNDSCLHSTISSLRDKYGIYPERRWETLHNEFNTRCMRYWLAKSDIQKAKEMVDFNRTLKGKKPLYRQHSD